MFDGRRSSLEISVFYVEFFIRVLFNRIIKLKKTKYYELPGNHAQTSIQEFLFPCAVKETMLLQISLVVPLEGCCLNFSHKNFLFNEL